MEHGYFELRHLRHFITLSETLNFGRAATRIGMAQPPFSQSIARLEQLIGYPLFERTRSGPVRVRLTSAGLALLPAAIRILRDVERTAEDVRATARGEIGTLRVAFVASLAQGQLPAVLGKFRRDNPGVRLQLSEATTGTMLQALADRSVDLGLGREIESSAVIEAKPLFQERLFAVLPADDAIAGRKRIALVALSDREFVLPPANSGTAFARRLLQLCRKAGFTPRLAQEATEWQTIIGLVGAGVGVSIVPESATRVLPSGVVRLQLSESQASTTVMAVWRAGEAGPLRDKLIGTLQGVLNDPGASNRQDLRTYRTTR